MTCDEPAVGLLVHGARLEGDRLTGRRGGPEHGKCEHAVFKPEAC